MDTAPILNNDRTMVPLRAIGEALGKIVYYNDKYICISDIDLNMSDVPQYLENLHHICKST